ncbi:PD-(D/E)XK nuclease family protein [Methylococcus capsulatus]|uniref:PD-(D/E)XK nuclease family protein n=1 Tax=Methylococcus capsulatus TaxID=414 RepID=UPI001C5332A5|nr:PD-(D/E)XK nuclease family protein [Methylococcus capsulatus]QXP87716.1 PD-(D/E)XK nuclease family protein [Methylococcus capsulatus]
MIHADLHGKTGVREDLVTSGCMGLLELLPNYIEFFGGAKDVSGNDLSGRLKGYSGVQMDFWHAVDGRIPDLIVTITNDNDNEIRLVIEVKFGAPLSPAPEGNQLAAYWCAANKTFGSRNFEVIYLTKDHGMPKNDMEEAKNGDANKNFYWISFYDLYRWCDEELQKRRCDTDKNILKLLVFYLEKKGCRVFRGFKDKLIPMKNSCFYRRVYNLNCELYPYLRILYK